MGSMKRIYLARGPPLFVLRLSNFSTTTAFPLRAASSRSWSLPMALGWLSPSWKTPRIVFFSQSNRIRGTFTAIEETSSIGRRHRPRPTGLRAWRDSLVWGLFGILMLQRARDQLIARRCLWYWAEHFNMCNSAAVCAIWIACLFLLHTDLSLALGNDIHLPHIDVESDANLPRVDVSYDPDDIRDTILTLQPDVVMVFRAVNVPKWTQFAVFQAHSQAHPLILSHNPTLSPGNHVNGTNIGLISRFAKDAINQEKQVYLINPHPFNVTIMVFIIFYDKRGESLILFSV